MSGEIMINWDWDEMERLYSSRGETVKEEVLRKIKEEKHEL